MGKLDNDCNDDHDYNNYIIIIVIIIIVVIIIIIIICQAGVAYDDDNDSYANNYNWDDDNVNYHSYFAIIFSFLFTDASSIFLCSILANFQPQENWP